MITFTFAGDEAGDVSLNFEKGASRYFVPVLISTQTPDILRDTKIRDQVFEVLSRANFQAWGLVVDKTRLPKIFDNTDSLTTYTHFITELLDIIPAELQKDATLILDEFSSTPDFRTELRRAMIKRQMPRLFKKVIIRPSNRESLIQIADLVAGAIMRRDTQDDTDAFDIISRKIKKLEFYYPLK